MIQILVTKPGVLNQQDKAKLRRAGTVVVEANDPAHVKLISASGAEVPAQDMLFAALSALKADKYSENTNQVFVKALVAAMELARKDYEQ